MDSTSTSTGRPTSSSPPPTDEFNAKQKPESKKPDDEIVDDETWTSGDFEVITVDCVRFRVPSSLLLVASKVFADAQSMASGDRRIELVGDNETKVVFKSFLLLISTGKITTEAHLLPGVLNLVRFLQKWDCPASLSTLLLFIEVKLWRGEIFPVEAFFIAAALNDEKLAEAALSQTYWTWDGSDMPTGGLEDVNCLDPRGWPLSLWAKWDGIRNYEYLWALTRVFAQRAEEDDIWGPFKDYLAAAKEK